MTKRCLFWFTVLNIGGLATSAALPAGQVNGLPDQRFYLEMIGKPTRPPVLAVPPFTVLTADSQTQAAAEVLTNVLRADLAFEREFYVLPSSVAAGIPSAQTIEDVPYDHWANLGADYVALGSATKLGTEVRVEVRVVSINDRRLRFGKKVSGTTTNVRLIAHSFSDSIHKELRQVDGVATTRIAFSSAHDRQGREIYVMDYDGENVQRITSTGLINIAPSWCPDGTCLIYTGYQAGPPAYPDIVLHYLSGSQAPSHPARGNDTNQNYMGDMSPDGTRIAFASARGGRAMDIFVVNRDGSDLRQLTTNTAIDNSPRWSPNGTQIAFVSDRSGSAQIYTMSADGLQQTRLSSSCSHSDRPTWAPSLTGVQIAYTCKTSAAGHDIDVYDFSTKTTRRLTDGQATNESPTFAPNGRHLMFFTSRWGRQELAVIDIDGKNLRRLTSGGLNSYPSWSGFLQQNLDR